ncbi:thioesterase II family protein [Fictibacillus fluitans]|uniref:Alpha/beta fold hydrolase n=1 Tax=Fictibacillus fluitans TaxID=3058422 RepID=A0ABT8HTJ8_9BACL|nr:alpha/beta fold hydrolase [Fictibacillus sp. NE201]MDN4524097.1 alpha/beta fold hydrolase [Fictibacillus sp. NE201]
MNDQESWFWCREPRLSPKIKVFCFPYAGGGSSIYRDWALGQDIELYAAQLPGRESRYKEPPISSMEDMIPKITEALLEYLDTPFALFGHSMGAVIAYEAACELKKKYGISPVHLFVSGRAAPQVNETGPDIYDLPQKTFIQRLTDLGGTPKEIIEDPIIFDFYEPMLRADFKLNATYQFTDREKLDCSISVLSGNKDKAVGTESLSSWREVTTGSATFEMFEGGHFFIRHQKRQIEKLMFRTLRDHNPTLQELANGHNRTEYKWSRSKSL